MEDAAERCKLGRISMSSSLCLDVEGEIVADTLDLDSDEPGVAHRVKAQLVADDVQIDFGD